ncbi:MAG: protein-glutamate methylesterase/protein-glutamine glutaminase [Candidatus Muiribacteriota bacterium]
MINVLVVDDSALMRKIIKQILEKDSEIQVVDTAMDGIFAVNKARSLKPDVITLDVEMPRKDGLQALKEIKETNPEIQVIMLSSLTSKNAETTLKSLEAGAFDFIHKPSGKSIDISLENSSSQQIIEKVKSAYTHRKKSPKPPSRMKNAIKKISIEERAEAYQKIKSNNHLNNLIAVGISTGGPNAILEVLPKLPADLNAAILIVQHMPAGFTEAYANRLNYISKLLVKEAKKGDIITNGKVFIAPGDKHIEVERKGVNLILDVNQKPQINHHRPSADILFESAAKNFGKKTMGIIMTGMGNDGAKNIGLIKQNGGYTIGQDEKSCIVYGMPRVADELGNLDKTVPLEKIYEEIIKFSK